MTGSAVKRSGTKWTVLFTLPFKQGGWFGRGVIPRFEPVQGGRIFKGGLKRYSFFASIFASILGWIWGHILDKNSTIFNVFRHSFSGYDFSCDYVSFGASLCAPRCPKMTFLLQKNSYFHGSACFSKVIGIITDFMDFYRFLVPVLAYLRLLLGSSFVH